MKSEHTTKLLETYPLWIVFLANLGSIFIYIFGFIIILNAALIPAFLYLIYILYLEFRLLRNHCINCFYWGKTCGFGKGKISSLLYKKGNSNDFCAKKITFKNMIPELFNSVAPLAAGVYLLIVKFNYIFLILMLIIIFATTAANSLIRGKLTCNRCKQRELGCPAAELFETGNYNQL